ncbi:MAG: hypothetical protein HFJ53_04450 [Clostridia bacterium]|nr:hypothetical protein [Clostridia bacterium]
MIKELAINKIPFVEEVPKIFLKYEEFKIFVSIKVTLSKIEYKLLSTEEKILEKILLIV